MDGLVSSFPMLQPLAGIAVVVGMFLGIRYLLRRYNKKAYDQGAAAVKDALEKLQRLVDLSKKG